MQTDLHLDALRREARRLLRAIRAGDTSVQLGRASCWETASTIDSSAPTRFTCYHASMARRRGRAWWRVRAAARSGARRL